MLTLYVLAHFGSECEEEHNKELARPKEMGLAGIGMPLLQELYSIFSIDNLPRVSAADLSFTYRFVFVCVVLDVPSQEMHLSFS